MTKAPFLVQMMIMMCTSSFGWEPPRATSIWPPFEVFNVADMNNNKLLSFQKI